MTTLQKLCVATFFTGVATVCLVGGTWLCRPEPLWMVLAATTSFAVGYLSYEFGDVVRAVPPAFALAWRETCGVADEITAALRHEISGLVNWFRQSHPFTFSSALLTLLSVVRFLVEVPPPRSHSDFGGLVLAILMLGVVSWALWALVLAVVALCGMTMRGQNVSLENGPYGYKDLAVWFLFGIVGLPCWYMWKFLGLGVYYTLRAIHSSKRLMVAVDGPLGGLLTLFLVYMYGPPSMTMTDYSLVALCGGLVSAALVAANYKYVTRILGVSQTA